MNFEIPENISLWKSILIASLIGLAFYFLGHKHGIEDAKIVNDKGN